MTARGTLVDVTRITGDRILHILPEDLRKNVFFASLIGSHAEGLATVTSDIDILLVHNDSVSPVLSPDENRPVLLDGLRVDIIRFSYRELEFLLESGRGNLIKLSSRQIEFIHKILKGHPIINQQNHEICYEILKIDDFNRGVYLRHLLMANDQYNDLVGLLEGRHIHAATETARSLTRSYADAFLALHGDTYSRSKWRLSKLERVLSQESPLFREILRIEFGGIGEISDESLHAFIGHCMAVVRALQLSCYFGLSLVNYLYTPSRNTNFTGNLSQIEILGEKFIFRNMFDEKAVDPLTALCLLADEEFTDAEIHSALERVNFDRKFSLKAIATRRRIVKDARLFS